MSWARAAGLVATVCAAGSLRAQSPLSADDIVARIRQHAGVTLPPRTVDTFKAGDPSTAVKGIAVTMMATLDVLQRAAAHGANFIITHEPTFYTHLDTTSQLTQEADETLAAKKAFIAGHGLVIFRFHDTPHAMKPDMINTGIARAVGWQNNTHNGNPVVFDIQPTTLASLASYVSGKLGARATRIAGNTNERISRVSFTQGFVGFTTNRHAFQNNRVDAIIIGEDHEWETIEYAVDAIAAGKLKGLIVIGHIPSEQAGMEEVTRWLKTFITEVPIEFIPTGDLLTRAPQTISR